MSKNKPVHIRMTFKNNEAQMFKAIKGFRGLEHNTEVCRVLLTEAYRSIPDEWLRNRTETQEELEGPEGGEVNG